MLNFDLLRKRLPDHVREPRPEIYDSNNYVCLDFETSAYGKGLPVYDENCIVLAAWSLGPEHPAVESGEADSRTRWFKFGGEFQLAELVRDVEAADFIIAHNAKFELGWLRRCGIDLTRVVVWDTMICDYVIGGNRWQYSHLSLNACAKRWLGESKVDVVSNMIKAGIDPRDIPESWLLRYCQKDVDLTERVFLKQRAEMETRLKPVLYTRCLLTPVLADIEPTGVCLDEEMVLSMHAEAERDYARLQQDLEEMTGGINLNSNDQLAAFIYDELGFKERLGRDRKPIRTGTNKRKVDESTIFSLEPSNKKQRKFLELYKEMNARNKALTKYLRKFADCCRDSGGILKAEFNQTSTQTHRLSSNGLEYKTQFQNFPRAYKPVFRARTDGWVIGEADGAQLEFRAAGHLGRDATALHDIVNGVDIHSVTASVIECTRQEAKAHTFKPLYGGRSGSKAEVRYYEFFRDKYQGITQTQERWISDVLRDKKLTTEWGLTYYWPDTRTESGGYVRNSTQICNYPVQAFATAEIIPVAVVYFWHYAKIAELEMMLVNTIHDSIIVEMPTEEINDFHQLAEVCLVKEVYAYLRDVYDVSLAVPLGAGVKVATHWAGSDAEAFVPDGVDHKNGEVIYTATENMYNGTTVSEPRASISDLGPRVV